MPFTLGGDWVPTASHPPKPLRVYTIKRKGKTLTVIQHLSLSPQEKEKFLLSCKKKWGLVTVSVDFIHSYL